MEWLFGIAVMAGMAILRLAVPLAIMATVIHFLHRLDIKWHPAPLVSGGE
jgi:hypothetical protein